MNASRHLSTESTNDDLETSSSLLWYIVFIVFGAFGVIDNAFVLFVIGRIKSLRNPTNLLIANQSLIDLTTSGLLLVLAVEPGVLYSDIPHLAEFVCVFWMSRYPFWSTITASSANLLVITCERFTAIVSPIRYRQRMTKRRVAFLSAIPWIYGFCVNSFIAAFTRLHGDHCDIVNYPSKEIQLGLTFLFFSLHFVGLIVTISILYVGIALHLRRAGDRVLGGKTKTADFRGRARRNVLRTMFIVFICYIICWAPNDIFVLNYSLNGGKGFEGPVYDFTVLMAFCNVWINPVIYCFRHESFQKAVVRLFGRDGRPRRDGSSIFTLRINQSN